MAHKSPEQSEITQHCIICADKACPAILKDSNFLMMLDIYWKGIGLDVKPDVNSSLSLCFPCFEDVLQFYQINDVLVYFEARLKQQQRSILFKNIEGIAVCKENGRDLHQIQMQIQSQWGSPIQHPGKIPIEPQYETILSQYTVTHSRQEKVSSSEEDEIGTTQDDLEKDNSCIATSPIKATQKETQDNQATFLSNESLSFSNGRDVSKRFRK